jgi:hypothetical protein
MPLESKKYSSIYIHRDEQLRWRWYLYAPTGVCFVSQQSYATTEEAVLAMQEYDAE